MYCVLESNAKLSKAKLRKFAFSLFFSFTSLLTTFLHPFPISLSVSVSTKLRNWGTGQCT